MTSGLLINVIRSLTSSVSDDQRQLERSRLEKGYAESGRIIDELLKEHQNNVGKCFSSFRKVSTGITLCRERIHNVKNALQTCKLLLQCRRDDLKKLWGENAEQKCLSNILQQIYDIKHIDQTIKKHLGEGNYCNAIQCLKKADILLNGNLSQIEGLSQLRTNVSNYIQEVFEKIVMDLFHCIVIVPFDCQILELIKTLNHSLLFESEVCTRILNKYLKTSVFNSTLPSSYLSLIKLWMNGNGSEINEKLKFNVNNINFLSNLEIQNEVKNLVYKKVVECLEALKVFDHIDSALEDIFLKTSSQCLHLINDTVTVLSLRISNGIGDETNFFQLCQTLIQQISDSAFCFDILLEELKKVQNTSTNKLLLRFWNIMQDNLELIVSDHLDIWRSADCERNRDSKQRNAKRLFSFENASFAVFANSSVQKKQFKLICPSSPYNISSVFHILNEFAIKVEQIVNEECRFGTYLHTFVMDMFIEKIKVDLENKTDEILNGAEVWSSLSLIPNYNVKVLTSCIRIFELCEIINNFIKNMGSYTQRFASIWFLIIIAYTKSAMDIYLKIKQTKSHRGENFVEYPKISAAWAVDEDISRLLKSLSSWKAINLQNNSYNSENDENSIIDESEQDLRHRNQRESEILIGNLGTQKKIEKAELITDMDHVKSLICIHESLQWFVLSMQQLLDSLPPRAQEILKCRVQFSSYDNGTVIEKYLNQALEEQLKSLSNMAETCLLMLYLEIRIHCFYHLLPLIKSRNIHQDDQDHEVMEFGRDLMQFYQTLSAYILPNKLKYLFGGLGHLCASIFIHSSQYINKLLEQDRKRICRYIYTIQKSLSYISSKPELELNRAQTFYKLINMEIDQIFALVKESGESYSYLEYTYLLSLVVRSHAILSNQPGALESILKQLKENLLKSN